MLPPLHRRADEHLLPRCHAVVPCCPSSVV
jgi:hypothetical protein